MKNKINLYWYRHNEGHGNFGDELNHYITSKLSGLDINHIDIQLFNLDVLLFFKTSTYSLLKGDLNLTKYLIYIYYYFIKKPKVLVSIGSVLGGVNSENYIVWGAGILSEKDKFKNADFRAVRGRFSQNRIEELGYKAPNTIGDPAILLPLIYKPNSGKKYKIGIIPHFKHYKTLKKYNNKELIVINLLDPIEKVIDEINSCEFTFSTSLHGVIVSHVYSIPSLWSEFSETMENKLMGDDIKFSDYFSSVEIEPYSPIYINSINMEIIKLMSDYSTLSLPNSIIIDKIQRGLLDAAPFSISKDTQQ